MTAREWTYGIQLPIQTLSRNVADAWEADASVADLVTVAQKAEATGHSFVGVCDHVAIPDDDYAARMNATWYDTVATLGFLAAHTTSVRLVSTVWIAPYRHPLQTASSFATLDHLSGGRTILGVGAGHVEGEFDALGVPFAERGAILDETLAALRGALDDTHTSFHGDRYRYDRVAVGPRPVSGSLPIWIGGSGRAAWRRVGTFGDGYIPMANPLEQYSEIVDTIRQFADEHGRSDAPIALGYMPGAARLEGQPMTDPLSGTTLSAEELAARLRAARTVGANTMHLKVRGESLQDYLEQLDAFEARVLPLVDEP